VFDAERHIECLKPPPMPTPNAGGLHGPDESNFVRLNFRFRTTYVERKKEGMSLLNEYTTTMEDPETGEVYYRCLATGFAQMQMRHRVIACDHSYPSRAHPVSSHQPLL
jgi:hypothetical protein